MKFSFKKYKEIILYVVFGFLTTAVNWVVYAISVKFFNINTSQNTERLYFYEVFSKMTEKTYFHLFLCNIIAWLAAVIFAFITNKIFVFKSKKWYCKVILKESLAFVGTRVFTGIIEIVGHTFFVAVGFNNKLFGVEGFWVKIIISIAVVVLNYIFSRFLVFKNKIS